MPHRRRACPVRFRARFPTRSLVRSFARPLVLVAALVGGLPMAPLHAQQSGPDVDAPVIEVERLDETPAGEFQVFGAQVADDRELRSVTLHHRREGERPFAVLPMQALDSAGRYTVSVPTDPDDLRSIEYYVQALDESGNRTVSGFAFDPLRRVLTSSGAPAALASRAPEPAPSPTVSSGRTRWWTVALGVVAVGALASLAGGGGGGEDGGGAGTVPLSLDIQTPASR